MKFFSRLFKKLKPAGVKNVLMDANIIFGAALLLLAVLAGLIVVDGYLFYTLRQSERATRVVAGSRAASSALSEQEIEDTIRLLDQRSEEYQSLLGTH